MAKQFGSASDYYEALRALEPSLRPHQIGLLLGHMAAPDHTLSWRELAQVVGYKSGGAVHLQYGKLARLVGERLGVVESQLEFQLQVLVDWGPRPDSMGHTTFRLRDEVVSALRMLGWQRAAGDAPKSTEARQSLSAPRDRPGSPRPGRARPGRSRS